MWVLTRYLTETMRTQTEMDQEAYNQEIRELTEERWRADFEDVEEDG